MRASGPALLAVAHGSRDANAAETITALAEQVSRLAPVLDVRIAFLEHAEPSLTDALAAAGTNAVVVPLLLSPGYHLTTDIAAAAAGVRATGPLGPDPLVAVALAARLADAGVPPGTPAVLAAAGSADPHARSAVARQAELLAKALAAPVVPAFAAASEPTVPDAVAQSRARTGMPVAVASYLLAHGKFHDRLGDSGADWVAPPLGSHPAVAALIIDRYRTHHYRTHHYRTHR